MKNAIISNLEQARAHGTDRAVMTDWLWPEYRLNNAGTTPERRLNNA